MKTFPIRSIQNWSYILLIVFFILSFINELFSFLGLLCMMAPIVISLKGYGKSNCSHLCPRGSFLGRVLDKVSFQKKIPKWILKKSTKNIVLVVIFINFGISLTKSFPDPVLLATALFRMIIITTVVGIVLGIIYKPRTWCTVCPMGYASGMITKSQKNRKAG